MKKRRNKDKERGGEVEKSTCGDMLRGDEKALTYIPPEEGSKTTGNMIVGDFRERKCGCRDKNDSKTGGREGEVQAGLNERSGKQVGGPDDLMQNATLQITTSLVS